MENTYTDANLVFFILFFFLGGGGGMVLSPGKIFYSDEEIIFSERYAPKF